MITDWRRDRRIGPPSASESLRALMVRPLIAVGASAAVATVNVLLQLTFGGELWSRLIGWPIMFAIIAGAFALQIGLHRRWAEAAVTAGLATLVFFVANALRFQVYAAITGASGAMIIPVTP